jgi:predicted protein tyrosine phosphatase
METRHKEILRQRFGPATADLPVEVLNIPDEYTFMDPELVAEIRAGVARFIPEAEG